MSEFNPGDRVYVRPLGGHGTVDGWSSYDHGAVYVILDEKPFNGRENRYSILPKHLERVKRKVVAEDIPEGYQLRDREDGETFRMEGGVLRQRYGDDMEDSATGEEALEILRVRLDSSPANWVFEPRALPVSVELWMTERGIG